MNPVGVLVSGGLAYHLMSVVVTGDDMGHRWEELGLCEVIYCDVFWLCWLCCCVGCCYEL